MSTLALFVWTIGDVIGVIAWGIIFILFAISGVLGWLASDKRWWNRRKK